VGGRVLTPSYVVQEIERVDVADLLARGAERVSQADLETATRAVASWAAEQLTPATASELVARLRALLVAQPAAPTLAAALRIVTALHSGLREVAKNPDHPLRARASEIVAELETRLTTDGALAARVEAAKNELLATPAVVALLDDLAAALRRTLLADLAAPRS